MLESAKVAGIDAHIGAIPIRVTKGKATRRPVVLMSRLNPLLGLARTAATSRAASHGIIGSEKFSRPLSHEKIETAPIASEAPMPIPRRCWAWAVGLSSLQVSEVRMRVGKYMITEDLSDARGAIPLPQRTNARPKYVSPNAASTGKVRAARPTLF
jgi:hypothetical protein